MEGMFRQSDSGCRGLRYGCRGRCFTLLFGFLHKLIKYDISYYNGNGVGDRFCHEYAIDAEQEGKQEGKGNAQEYLPEDTEKERVTGIAHGDKHILVDHLHSDHKVHTEINPDGAGTQGDQTRIRGEDRGNLSREEQHTETEGRGTDNRADTGIIDGAVQTFEVFSSITVAHNRLGALYNSLQRHKENLVQTADDSERSDIGVTCCHIRRSQTEEPDKIDLDQTFVDAEDTGGDTKRADGNDIFPFNCHIRPFDLDCDFFGVIQRIQHPDGGGSLRNDRSPGCARDSHIKSEDKDWIQDDINSRSDEYRASPQESTALGI